MAYNNEEYVSPHWAGFRGLWWTVAIILFLLILLLWLLGYGCGGDNCQPPVETIVEKPVVLAPTPIVQTVSANCVFNPNNAQTNTKVIATCTGVEAGGSVNIMGMSCSDVMNGIVLCETDQSANIGNNPAVTTLGASGKSINSIGEFSLLTSSPELVATPVARLYFDISSDQLPSDATQTLDSVVAFLRDNSEATAYISGFHDPSGNYEFNQDLSKRRAQSVEKLLLETGIASERIILEKPVETTGTGASKEARRVEVSVKVN